MINNLSIEDSIGGIKFDTDLKKIRLDEVLSSLLVSGYFPRIIA